MDDACTTERFFLLPGGIMFTWLALLVLKLATILLESTALIFRLLLLLLLLLMLLLTLRTRVRTPAANAAKSTALPPDMMDVEEALVHDCTWGWKLLSSTYIFSLGPAPRYLLETLDL